MSKENKKMENQQLLQVQSGDKLLQAVLHSRISEDGIEIETVNGWEKVLVPVSTVWLDIKPEGVETHDGTGEAKDE